MKYVLASMCILAAVLLPQKANAAAMQFQHVPDTVAGKQQFYVDVMVDAQGDDFNGLQGSVTFSSGTLSFVRAETGSSVLTYFVDPPTAQGGTIHFAGIVIGGFKGLINPFDQSRKLPGQVMRLVFEGTNPGAASIVTSGITYTANDGNGTLQSVANASASLTVSPTVSPSTYNPVDTIMPTLTASVVTDKNLYEGRYTLIFNAVDKQSGIDRVEVKEGGSAWTVAESPYLLHDQSRKGILLVRAYDVAGNVTTVTIPAARKTSSVGAIIFLALVVLIILYVIHKKSKHPKHLHH